MGNKNQVHRKALTTSRLDWLRQVRADIRVKRGYLLGAQVLQDAVNSTTGKITRGYDWIAEKAGRQKRWAIYMVNALVELGHLGIERRGGRHLTSVCWPILNQKTVYKTVHACAPFPAETVHACAPETVHVRAPLLSLSTQPKKESLASLGSPPRKKASGRGSRLAEDFKPRDKDWELAGTLLGNRREIELEKFRDHWAAAPSQKGVKADWNAAFRNWVRKAKEFNGRGGSYAADSRRGKHEFQAALDDLRDFAHGDEEDLRGAGEPPPALVSKH